MQKGVKLLSFLLVSGFIFTQNTYANLGGSFELDKKFSDSSCMILVHHKKQSPKEFTICSGTLIASDKILTAKHCLNEMAEAYEVGCGFRGLEGELEVSKNNIIVGNQRFVEKTFATSATFNLDSENINGKKIDKNDIDSVNYSHDSMILTLKDKMTKIQPVLMNQDLSGVQACFVAGYGSNEKGIMGNFNYSLIVTPQQSSIGVLSSPFLTKINYNKSQKARPFETDWIKDLIPNIIVETIQGGITLFGDSGGSLYCVSKEGALGLYGSTTSVLIVPNFAINTQEEVAVPSPQDFYGINKFTVLDEDLIQENGALLHRVILSVKEVGKFKIAESEE